MALSKKEKWTLTVIHFLLAAFLLWGAGKRGYNFYVVLRFVVCLGSVYIAYSWRRTWFISLIFVAVAVLFNPFTPFRFDKATWSDIDFWAAVFFAFTAVMYLQA